MAPDSPDPLSPEEFRALYPVSRETAAKFELYLNLLSKWNKTINLVSSRSLEDPWRRHILDSAQLAPLIPDDLDCIVDLGSGAGLPGLVLALLHPHKSVHLIESDQRKAAFLREAARTLDCKITVHAERVECALESIQHIDVITARALASLPGLMKLIIPVLNEKKLCIFPKTKGINKELDEMGLDWVLSHHVVPSLSDPRGEILVLEVKKGD